MFLSPEVFGAFPIVTCLRFPGVFILSSLADVIGEMLFFSLYSLISPPEVTDEEPWRQKAVPTSHSPRR